MEPRGNQENPNPCFGLLDFAIGNPQNLLVLGNVAMRVSSKYVKYSWLGEHFPFFKIEGPKNGSSLLLRS